MEILQKMHSIVCEAVEDGWNVVAFIDKSLSLLESCKTTENEEQIKILYDCERLRRLYETHLMLSSGYRLFVEDFEHLSLG